MSDLIKRLRRGTGDGLLMYDWCNEAADEIERLNEALFRIADHPVEQSRQWEVGAKEMMRLARMAINGEFKSPYHAISEDNDRLRTAIIKARAALGEGKE